jgi:nicotinamide phosphoribosyltransferase
VQNEREFMEDWNLLLATDSYKISHGKCYDKGITKIYSYLEARGGKFPATLFFGLQYYLEKYLCGIQVTKEKIDEAEKFWTEHFGRSDCFDRSKWEYILHEYDGCLPLTIEAVPEGTLVPVLNALMVIVNNDPKCFWLTNFVETLLMKVWYPTTVATQSFYIRQKVMNALEKSGDPSGINFKVHDFGYRGVSSEETAALGAAGHLISFMGTDTVAGILLLKKHYQAQMSGYSIPATEHSIMCSFGRNEEATACENFLDTYPTGLIACVSDTYDIYNCCEKIWGGILKEKVLKRDGCLVIRPDSGNPLEVVPKVLQILWDRFGGITNGKGFKVLDSHVRVIQGDGMDFESIGNLYEHIMSLGWSADNLAVGSGGGLLQKLNRDTCKFAIKCSAALKNNVWIDVFKEPITDNGKRSKSGRFQTVRFKNGDIDTRDFSFTGMNGENLLHPVFENGKILKTYSLEQIKKNTFG